MTRYLLRALRARLHHGRSLLLLSVLGVALGVASVLSIQLINASAIGAFSGAVEAVSGDADLTVLGVLPVIPDSLVATVLGVPGVTAASPLVRVEVALARDDEVYIEIIGVDFYAGASVPWQGPVIDLSSALVSPGWVAIAPALANDLGVAVGDRLPVTSGADRIELEIGALVDFQRLTPLASRKLALMDIAQAQHLFGGGGIDQIDVRVSEGASVASVAAALTARVGRAARVVTPDARRRETQSLLRAFSLNLTAMSLISLVVGCFLILAATQASLVRRRTELGLLRALGATRAQLMGLILSEVALLALLGVAIGVPLGFAAARVNLDVVSTSLSNLYLIEEVERLHAPFSVVLVACAVGVVGALLGALAPTIDMARRDTRELLSAYTLDERLAIGAGRWFVLGIVVMVLTVGWFVTWGRDWRPAGFVLAFGLILPLPLLTPLAVRLATGGVRVTSFGLAYAARTLRTRLHTAALATSALAIAVSMMVGVTIMIGSFRETVDVWADAAIHADVYVTSRSWKRAGSDASLDPALIERFAALPSVERLSRLRRFPIVFEGVRVFVNGFDIDREAGGVRLLAGRLPAPGATEVMVSEPFARSGGRSSGDVIELTTPDGVARFDIVGVYYDYSPEGEIGMELGLMQRSFGAGGVQSLAFHLVDGVEPTAMVDVLRGFPEAPALEIRDNRSIRQAVLDIFDQTFAITRILEVMGLLVATCGIALALIVLARERAHELALYGALGARRRQIFRVFVAKGLAIAGIGTVLGVVGGLMLAAVLVLVINRSYFGWTIQPYWPATAVGEQLVTILAAAVLASLYPALRASRTPATELSREEH